MASTSQAPLDKKVDEETLDQKDVELARAKKGDSSLSISEVETIVAKELMSLAKNYTKTIENIHI